MPTNQVFVILKLLIDLIIYGSKDINSVQCRNFLVDQFQCTNSVEIQFQSNMAVKVKK